MHVGQRCDLGERSRAAPQFYCVLVSLPSVEARGRWRERGRMRPDDEKERRFARGVMR